MKKSVESFYGVGVKKIQITLGWDDEMLFVTVNDQGEGFSAETLANPGLNPHPAHTEGQGLGLMLTRAAIEQNGGKLALQNMPNGGASAQLSFPLLPNPTPR